MERDRPPPVSAGIYDSKGVGLQTGRICTAAASIAAASIAASTIAASIAATSITVKCIAVSGHIWPTVGCHGIFLLSRQTSRHAMRHARSRHLLIHSSRNAIAAGMRMG